MSTPPPSILSFLTPSAAIFPPEEYDGYQIRWKNFVFRPAEFKYEALALIALVVYFALYFFGKSLNEKGQADGTHGTGCNERALTHCWYFRFGAHYPQYASQFSRPTNGSALLSDGASDFFVYSTGRRGVHYMHTIFTMLPRHDIFQILFQKAYGLTDLQYAPKDEVLLDIKLRDTEGLGGEGKGFVWGVVAKNEMQALRKQRWDVSFTKTTDNAAVAPTLSVMAEVADITDVLLKSPSGQALAKVLNDPSVVKHLKYLLITDQPAERPENGPVPANQRERHLLLSLYVPEPSEATNTVPLLKEVFNLVDVVDQKAAFKIEACILVMIVSSPADSAILFQTHKKLKKTRADLDVELQKEAEKEKRDEAEEKKAAEKRKAAEERLARLSAAEQKKASKSHCFAAAYL
ncbi:endoplasmic reticulum membrane protein [Ceratobasidium sp. AG-Ba]|nr:endoplasmic reticulum membrane protein [Ceratobasidium sp. AG-Ba]